MALTWEWHKKIGEMEVYDSRTDRDYSLSLYEGNGFLMALYEYIDADDNTEKYSLAWFFADKRHAENCLGLSKGYNNIFDDGYFISLHFEHLEYSRHWQDIIKVFLKAYPKLKITIN